MKTAISLPDQLFAQTDRLATQLGKSRSEVIADALRGYLIEHGDAAITKRLNAVHGGDDAVNADDVAFRRAAAARVAERNPW